MVHTPIKRLTLDEFLQLPETKPASEFLHGHISQKPMPQGKHSALQGDVVPAVNQVLRSQTRVIRTILHCLDCGTQMGWLIDPEEELIFVYRDDRTLFVFDQPQVTLPVPAFASAIQLTVGQVFNWLQD